MKTIQIAPSFQRSSVGMQYQTLQRWNAIPDAPASDQPKQRKSIIKSDKLK